MRDVATIMNAGLRSIFLVFDTKIRQFQVLLVLCQRCNITSLLWFLVALSDFLLMISFLVFALVNFFSSKSGNCRTMLLTKQSFLFFYLDRV